MSNVSMIDGHIDREERKLTDKEIIKALECCINSNCGKCPMIDREDCDLDKLTLDLINRQQAEIESITEKFNCQQTVYADLSKIIKDKNAEIERLQKENEILSSNADNAFQEGLNEDRELYSEEVKKQVRAEAIKEFSNLIDKDIEEKLSNSIKEQNPHLYLIHQIVKDRLKEMVGDGATECQKKTRYIVGYDNWLFESYVCESCFGWDVYQLEKTDSGYKLRVHILAEEPVVTVEDAKEYVERWREANEIADTVDGAQLMADIVGLINHTADKEVE